MAFFSCLDTAECQFNPRGHLSCCLCFLLGSTHLPQANEWEPQPVLLSQKGSQSLGWSWGSTQVVASRLSPRVAEALCWPNVVHCRSFLLFELPRTRAWLQALAGRRPHRAPQSLCGLGDAGVRESCQPLWVSGRIFFPSPRTLHLIPKSSVFTEFCKANFSIAQTRLRNKNRSHRSNGLSGHSRVKTKFWGRT